ncbi:sugar phosphate isomerase/epimerase [Marispirochaeta aestuarii]|uniref:sugar phosphate isomerase/epimerase family protein n=1 Tax=Marispirochaeta aestuarii TaxID=1963862 RepID=UPI0029C7C035|nr:sugar phosphate isomerase/epimerase [Marispirochaeta aestuarii]
MENRICYNLSALIHLDFEQQLIVASRAGFRAVGVRDRNLEDFLSAGNTLTDARHLLDKNKLISVEYNFFSNWVYAQDGELARVVQDFDHFCACASALGEEPVLIAPVAFENRNTIYNFSLAVRNLRELGRVAAAYGGRVAMEFLPWTRINSIETAWDIVRDADRENIGIVLDAFHYFEGSSTKEGLREVPVEKIFLCHLNDMNTRDGDILKRTRECRVLPGEGSYDLGEIISILEMKGYTGYYSLEILNTEYRNLDPARVSSRAYASMHDILGAYFP